MQKEVVMMEIKKVLPVIFTLRSDFHQFSFNADCWSDFYIHRNDAGNSHGLINPHLSIYGSKVHILNTIFYNLAWTLWREESSFRVFVCLLLISVKASFVLVTQNTTGNPWMIHRCTDPISFFHLLLLIFAHNRTHKQTHNTSGFHTQSTKTHFLPSSSLVNTHSSAARWASLVWYRPYFPSDRLP